MKRYAIAAIALLLLAAVRPAFGVVLLTKDAALKEMFGAAKVVTETKTLTDAQIEAVKEEVGGKWTLYEAGGATDGDEEIAPVEFHFATTDGNKIGVALVEVQPGKWGPVTYIVALDMTGKVTNAAVMSYTEKRGRPISTKRFLGQFTGKTKASALMVGKDIDAVSGATISSRATAFAVKKVLALYDVVCTKPAEEE